MAVFCSPAAEAAATSAMYWSKISTDRSRMIFRASLTLEKKFFFVFAGASKTLRRASSEVEGLLLELEEVELGEGGLFGPLGVDIGFILDPLDLEEDEGL